MLATTSAFKLAQVKLAVQRQSQLLGQREQVAFGGQKNSKGDFLKERPNGILVWTLHDAVAMGGDLGVKSHGSLFGVAKDGSKKPAHGLDASCVDRGSNKIAVLFGGK
jgi:hypothetical protein